MGRCVDTHRLLLEARVVVLDHREQRVHRERHAVQVARDRVLREVGLDARPRRQREGQREHVRQRRPELRLVGDAALVVQHLRVGDAESR